MGKAVIDRSRTRNGLATPRTTHVYCIVKMYLLSPGECTDRWKSVLQMEKNSLLCKRALINRGRATNDKKIREHHDKFHPGC